MKARQEYINIILEHAPILKERFDISQLTIFGSVARDEHSEGSDIDIFVDMPAVYYNYAAASDYLEEILGCKVDLIRNRTNLRPSFRDQINKYGVQIIPAA